MASEARTGLRMVAGYGGLLGLLGLSLAIAIPAAAGRSLLVPAARGLPVLPDWLAGPFGAVGGATIDYTTFGWRLVAMFACYLVALWGARALPPAAVGGAVVALLGVALLAPPLASADVFGYLGFARMGVLHGTDPYTHLAGAMEHDPIRAFLRGRGIESPYGPLFTLGSYALVPLGIEAGIWAFKAIAWAAALALVAIVWDAVARRGRAPAPAVLLIAANPVVLVFAIAGAHNDALVMLALTAAVAWTLRERARPAGVALALACGLKASAGVVAPYMVIGTRERGRLVLAAVMAGVAIAIAAAIGFGTDALRSFAAIDRQQDIVAYHAIPNAIGRLLGYGGITDGIRAAGVVLFAAVVALTLWRAWRGADWVVCAGWATVALLVTSAWLLPWYVLWVLPLAAIGGDRRLTVAALALTAYMVATRVPFLLG